MASRAGAYFRDGFVLLGIAGLAFLVVWFLIPKNCHFNKPVGNLGVDLERKLGVHFEKTLRHDPGIVTTPAVTHTVSAVLARVVSGASNLQFPVRAIVVRNREANAFTFPGGVLVVYTGLLALCDGPGELAGVLAHELAHVEHRDSARALMQQVGYAVLLAVVTGGNAGQAGDLVQRVLALQHGRSAEASADAYAAETLRRAQVRPVHLARFFRKVKSLGSEDESWLRWLGSHPDLDSRIAATEKAEKQDTPFHERPFDLDWSQMKRHLPSSL